MEDGHGNRYIEGCTADGGQGDFENIQAGNFKNYSFMNPRDLPDH